MYLCIYVFDYITRDINTYVTKTYIHTLMCGMGDVVGSRLAQKMLTFQ